MVMCICGIGGWKRDGLVSTSQRAIEDRLSLPVWGSSSFTYGYRTGKQHKHADFGTTLRATYSSADTEIGTM
jgi:hypothetical protein